MNYTLSFRHVMSISGIIAEVVLQDLELTAMNDYKPKFWARYVDDMFVVIKHYDKTGFMEKLNSVHPDIQFTAEEEVNNTLSFLDILIHREHDGTLTTSVYCKTTHTNIILHNDSNHPTAHKISCICTLFNRINTHCSTATEISKEYVCTYLYISFLVIFTAYAHDGH